MRTVSEFATGSFTVGTTPAPLIVVDDFGLSFRPKHGIKIRNLHGTATVFVGGKNGVPRFPIRPGTASPDIAINDPRNILLVATVEGVEVSYIAV